MHQYTPRTRTSNTFIRTRSCVVVQMSQVETEMIFLFMHVKRFKWSFSVVSFYIQLYTKQKFRVGKFKHFFRVGRLTGNRGTFVFGL